jgi:predicted signal transduction protein with EAL and GGDEF domain
LQEDQGSAVIVRSIIGLAHSLGLSVVAEGVENYLQLAIMRELMCDQIQGYLLGRPLAMDGPVELVAARARSLLLGGPRIVARSDALEAQGRRSDGNVEGVGSLP